MWQQVEQPTQVDFHQVLALLKPSLGDTLCQGLEQCSVQETLCERTSSAEAAALAVETEAQPLAVALALVVSEVVALFLMVGRLGVLARLL
jgi:hypothetical protein